MSTLVIQSEVDLPLEPFASRMAFFALGFMALAAVATAVLLQNLYELRPCPWCILQRYAFLVLGGILLARAAVPIRGRCAIALGWAGALAATIGASMATFHLVVVSSIKVSCGRDTLAAFLNGLPSARLIPSVFEATGSCADAIPVNFPALAFVGFGLLGAGCIWLSLRQRSR